MQNLSDPHIFITFLYIRSILYFTSMNYTYSFYKLSVLKCNQKLIVFFGIITEFYFLSMTKLGVSAEENDYPEPKPPYKPSKQDKNQSEHISVTKGNTSDTTTPQEGEKVSTKSILGEEYQVELVPVGASFKNSIAKGVEVKNEIESLPSASKTSWSSYPVVRTIATSLSLRDSLQGSIHVDSSGTLSGISQREAMLADRERHEYLKLMAPSTETVTHKGQIRRYNYDGPQKDVSSTLTDKFRTVEDRLADEIADKVRKKKQVGFI